MAKSRNGGRAVRLEGLIQPQDGTRLRIVWKAFATGGTWERTGSRSRLRTKYRHARYPGRLRLEWWGLAIHFRIDDPSGSGQIGGAFFGHVQRHGRPVVDRIELRMVAK